MPARGFVDGMVEREAAGIGFCLLVLLSAVCAAFPPAGRVGTSRVSSGQNVPSSRRPVEAISSSSAKRSTRISSFAPRGSCACKVSFSTRLPSRLFVRPFPREGRDDFLCLLRGRSLLAQRLDCCLLGAREEDPLLHGIGVEHRVLPREQRDILGHHAHHELGERIGHRAARRRKPKPRKVRSARASPSRAAICAKGGQAGTRRLVAPLHQQIHHLRAGIVIGEANAALAAAPHRGDLAQGDADIGLRHGAEFPFGLRGAILAGDRTSFARLKAGI